MDIKRNVTESQVRMKYYVYRGAKWFIIIFLTLLVLRVLISARQFLLQKDSRYI